MEISKLNLYIFYSQRHVIRHTKHNRLESAVVEQPLRVRKVAGLIPGWVIPKTVKMVPDVSRLIDNQHQSKILLLLPLYPRGDGLDQEIAVVIHINQIHFYTIDQK